MPVIPDNVMDKIRNLIDKLKKFPAIPSYYEMQNFLDNNPSIKTLLKHTAVTAGIAILVATIVEDILTAGIGIADDVPSCMLAYRLVTIAL